MIGEISAVASAVLWSTTNIMVRSASERMGILALNALRTTAGAVFVVATLFAVGRAGEVGDVPLRAAVYMVIAVVVGMAIGDSLYFRSMASVGVSRASPVSNVYPLFTLPVSLFFLGEDLTWLNGVGVVLIVVGVSLVARSSAPRDRVAIREEVFRHEGLLLALAAALCWAFSTTVQKLALIDLDVVVANSIRTPAAALLLLILASRSNGGLRMRSYGWRAVLLSLLAGVVSLGVGGFLYLVAIQEAGAAKTAALSSIAPIFAAPMSMFFFKEKLSAMLAAGIVMSVAGVWLTI